MPSLVRFLVVVLVLAALVGAAMFYLANFVEPRSRRNDRAHSSREAGTARAMTERKRGAGSHHVEAFLEMMSAERGAAPQHARLLRRDLDDYGRFLGERGSGLERARHRAWSAPISSISTTAASRRARWRGGSPRSGSSTSSCSARACAATIRPAPSTGRGSRRACRWCSARRTSSG